MKYMDSLSPKNQRGLTLMELIIVIAIVGLLAAIALATLGRSQEQSRNAARVSQIQEYIKAFNLSYSTIGEYPTWGSGSTGSIICLGHYDDGRCWQTNINPEGSAAERSAISDAIVPTYMPLIPTVEATVFGGESGSPTYEGMTYQHTDYGRGFVIQYFMEGEDQNCQLSNTSSSNVGGDTLCVYTSS